jgi:starch phosphorylase
MTDADPAPRRIAYFTMEIGLEPEMPTYSGGLGVLAGDTVRAAADLGLPMVGVSLLYRQGFFHQHLAADGYQSEAPEVWEPDRFLERVDSRVSIVLNDREVVVCAWLYRVLGAGGAFVPIYLLDTDVP